VLLEGMGRLGYDAVNVGERDVRMGWDALRALVGDPPFELVSANIVRVDTGEPVFAPSLVVRADSPAGTARRAVGIVGVTRFNPIFRGEGPGGSALRIDPPIERVRAEVERLAARGVDVIVLLAAMHQEDARRLVEEVPGIHFVVGSYGGAVTETGQLAGRTHLLYSGNQGKRIGETRVWLEGGAIGSQTTRMHFMTAAYPTSQPMLDFVNRELETSAPAAPAAAASAPAVRMYVGSDACRTCHASEHAGWSGTAHASAVATLDAEDRGGEAACLACHTTGAGRDGGFTSRGETPELAEVGCESCHGPGLVHVARPAAGFGKVSVDTCIACHDVANDPDFDYYRDVKQVDHRTPR